MSEKNDDGAWMVYDSISRIKYPGFASRKEAEGFARSAGLQQTSIAREEPAPVSLEGDK